MYIRLISCIFYGCNKTDNRNENIFFRIYEIVRVPNTDDPDWPLENDQNIPILFDTWKYEF